MGEKLAVRLLHSRITDPSKARNVLNVFAQSGTNFDRETWKALIGVDIDQLSDTDVLDLANTCVQFLASELFKKERAS